MLRLATKIACRGKMMNSSVAKLVLTLLSGVGAGLYPMFSSALELGDLQVESRLNQPLHAHIEIVGISDDWH